MYGFTSYHWDVTQLGDDDRAAVAALNASSPPAPHLGLRPADPAVLTDAFRTLLGSADPRARAVALDQYTYTETQGRWGVQNPFEPDEPSIRAVALALLDLEPSYWNSALSALTFVGPAAGELDRIVAVLDRAARAGVTLDVHAFWALEVRLVDAPVADCARVGAWLAGLVASPEVPPDVRAAAAKVFRDDRFADRLGRFDDLAALLPSAPLPLAVEIACVLAPLPEHEDAVRAAVLGWPPDAPYPAHEVRDLLNIPLNATGGAPMT